MGWSSESKYQRTWRPVSIAEAHRHSVSWSRRNEARDRLDDLSYAHQKTAADSALGRNVRDSELKTRPQRGPLHTHYPAFPAARACLGLSAVSEFKAHAGEIGALLGTSANLPPAQRAKLDPGAMAQTQAFVAEAVANRLCIDQLYHLERLGAVESYRLFAAATIDRRFTRLKDVILAAVVLGDLVSGILRPEEGGRELHPLTRDILHALADPCRRYEAAVVDCVPEKLPDLGSQLAVALMRALGPFLPLKQAPQPPGAQPPDAATLELAKALEAMRRVPVRKRGLPPVVEDALSKPLAGSEEPVPPAIDEPSPWPLKEDAAQAAESSGEGENHGRLRAPGVTSPEDAQVRAALQRAASAIAEATRGTTWDDPRVDQVNQAMRQSLFAPGAVEAQLATHRHKVKAYGSEREGRIEEQALSRCRDQQALDQVRKGAAPIVKKLRGYKWFGQRTEAQLHRRQASGSLDPASLHRLATSQLLRRRWCRSNVTDYRGKPVVILAKDGSSSNSLATTFAGKVLAAAFLRIARLARIQLFAADYSSGAGGPMVQWLYHPQKTPGRGALEASDAVASLPPKGQGSNEDVLSISHIVQQVLKVPSARRQRLVLINITDGKFNRPLPEVRSMVDRLRREHGIIYSLVVLGNVIVEVPEADHVLQIPAGELQQAGHIADRIARHVHVLVRGLRGKGAATHV